MQHFTGLQPTFCLLIEPIIAELRPAQDDQPCPVAENVYSPTTLGQIAQDSVAADMPLQDYRILPKAFNTA
ncbi:MAG: hypothetical protein QMB52_07280 [Propionivibrio sp.]